MKHWKAQQDFVCYIRKSDFLLRGEVQDCHGPQIDKHWRSPKLQVSSKIGFAKQIGTAKAAVQIRDRSVGFACFALDVRANIIFPSHPINPWHFLHFEISLADFELIMVASGSSSQFLLDKGQS